MVLLSKGRCLPSGGKCRKLKTAARSNIVIISKSEDGIVFPKFSPSVDLYLGGQLPEVEYIEK